MQNKKIALFLIHFSFLILITIPNFVLGANDNWVEVATFSENRPRFGDTTSFAINHNEWRIRWEYEIFLPNLTAFFFDVKIQDTGKIIEGYDNGGKLDITQGILNINGHEGDFFLFIGSNGKSYSITVEENIDSIPEFPSWALFPICGIATIVTLVVRNKMKKRGLE